jgi:prepilin-type processing-associated H-X9-DG protein
MMTRTGLAVLLLVALAAGLCAAAEVPPPPAAGVPFGDLLSGRDYPLSLTLKDLDNTWRTFSMNGEGDASRTVCAAYTGPGKIYFTKGQTTTVTGRQQFLIAYSTQLGPPDPGAIMAGRGGEPQFLAQDSTLRLALLNVASLGTLADIRVFDREAEIAAFNRGVQGLQDMLSSRPQHDNQTGPAAGTPLANLKNVALAAVTYAIDYDKYPPMKTPQAFRSALSEYVKDAVVFKDPTTGAFFVLNAGLSEKPTTRVADASKTVLAYQEKADKDGKRGVAYADGHVASLTETE